MNSVRGEWIEIEIKISNALTPCKWNGCGAPGASAATMVNEISIVEFDGRE